MRLLQCEIENFGKLSNVSFDFREGCNVFAEDNGWGKSTLAAFIKVMFYGFDGERMRDVMDNERKRYKPWQGGVYGGSLSFETKGKTYRITRIFGAKDKEDVFELRDAKTNLTSEDYTENIGEELFQIDSHSFARTIYISQNDCETIATDSINAKIGNLADHTDDINNFETVMDAFGDILNKMSPRRKTGALAIRKERIVSLEQQVRQGSAIEQALNELTRNRDAKSVEYNGLKAQQKELEEKQKTLGVQKDLQTKRAEYQSIAKIHLEKEMAFQKEQGFFPGELPQEEELDEMIARSANLVRYKQSADNYVLSQTEKEHLDSLRVIFGDIVPSEAEVRENERKIDRYRDLDVLIAKEEAKVEVLKQEQNPRKNVPMIIAGVLLLAIGIAAYFVHVIASVIALVAGVGCLVFGLLSKKAPKPSPELVSAEAALNVLQEEQKSIQKQLPECQKKTGRNVDNFRILKQKEDNYQKAQKAYEKLLADVTGCLIKWGFVPEVDMGRQLTEIRQHVMMHRRAKEELLKAMAGKQAFEEANDMARLLDTRDSIDSEESLEDIGREMQGISSQLEVIHQHILSYERQLEAEREKLDEIARQQEVLQELKEAQEEDMLKYKRIEKTRDLLERAKATFTQKYMEPLMTAFEKYYGTVTKNAAEGYQLDADVNMTVKEHGMQRETRFLSAGYRDLIGICMRMALVDAMYKQEKPFVIFDDPFVNLDREKTEGGLKLLQEIAKEYQVLYFTCHESRV